MTDTTQQRALAANVRRFYLFKILEGVSFFAPIIVLFWQQNGLSMTQIMVLQSLFAITMVLLDVPTGYLADVYGRKSVLFLSGAFLATGNLIYFFGHGFWTFLAAELLLGCGLSLISGADAALLYDTLKEHGQEKRYAKIWGHGLFLAGMSMMVTQILGGVIGSVDYRWTLLACVPLFLLIIPVAAGLHEPRREKRVGMRLDDLRAAVKYIIGKQELRMLLLTAGVIAGLNQAALWLYQPFFQATGIAVAYFGILFAGFQLFSALSGKYAHLLERRLGQRNSLILLVTLTSASYLLMGAFVTALGILFILLQQFVRGYQKVVVTDYVNGHATADLRATVLSAQSMMGRIVYAAVIPIVGWIVDAYSLVQALYALGVTTAVCGTALLLLMVKKGAL